jgi:hypothetical protein
VEIIGTSRMGEGEVSSRAEGWSDPMIQTGISSSMGSRGTGLMRQAGHGIGCKVRCARMVFDFEYEFRQSESPPGESVLCVGQNHDPTQGVLIISNGELCALEVGS